MRSIFGHMFQFQRKKLENQVMENLPFLRKRVLFWRRYLRNLHENAWNKFALTLASMKGVIKMHPPNQHGFYRYCIDGNVLVERMTLRAYVQELGVQAMSARAVRVCHDRPRKRNSEDQEFSICGYKSPIYFGEGGEFLRHCYFEYFGGDREYGLKDVWSVNTDHGSIPDDLGWDGGAVTIDGCHPVYFQDKTTEDHQKKHQMNDGSRIMNFVGSAAMHSIAVESIDAERARFILWTTAAGLDRTLLERLHGKVEVVACKSITRKVDGNKEFWNMVAEKLSGRARQ